MPINYNRIRAVRCRKSGNNIQMNNKNINVYKNICIACFLFILSLLYYYPLVGSLHALGIQDWDVNFVWNEFTRLSIQVFHQFPLWDPYRCGGAVHFANPQIGVISIQTILVLLFGTIIGIKFSIIVHGIIGSIGYYLLARHYKLSRFASLTTSIICSFSGIVGSYLSTGMVIFIANAYAPYVLLFYNKGASNKKWIIAAAGVFALSYYFEYHIPLILSVYLIVYTVFMSLVKKNRSYLSDLLLFGVVFIVFSAPKLIVSLQIASLFNSRINDPSGYTLYQLVYFLLSRNQKLLENISTQGYTYNIDEYSLYVGILPILLFINFFIRNKQQIQKYLPLLLTLAVMVLLMLGRTTSPSLYAWLKQIPIFFQFRVSQRFRFDFIIPFALIAGLGLDKLISQKIIKPYATPLCVCIVLVLFFDLASFSSSRFLQHTLIVNDTFPRVFAPQFSQITTNMNTYVLSYRNDPLVKTKNSASTFTPSSLEFIALRQNLGITHCYDTVTRQIYVKGSDESGYRGEWYTLDNSRKITVTSWSPNVVTLALGSPVFHKTSDILVLNQNYNSGWYGEKNGKLYPAESLHGLLSIPVTSTDQSVTFRFLPYRGFFEQMKRAVN